MPDSVKFLGSFQTFIGVIASILVLCLFIDKANLQYSLLSSKHKGTKTIIKSLQRRIDTIFRKVSKKQSSEFAEIFFEEAMQNQVMSQTPPNIVQDADSMIKHLYNLPLRVTAPVYTLLCCLFLFLGDCVVIIWPETIDSVVSIATFVLFASVVFWLVLWWRAGKDLKSHYSEKKKRGPKKKDHPSSRPLTLHNLWMDRRQPVNTPHLWVTLGIFIAMLMLAFLISLGVAVLCFTYLQTQSPGIWVFYGLVALLIIYGGYGMCCSSNTKWNYSYRHASYHWLAFMILGGCIVMCVMPFSSSFSFSLQYSSPYYIVGAWTLFLLVNGLGVPILFPYFGYDHVVRVCIREIRKKIEEIS